MTWFCRYCFATPWIYWQRWIPLCPMGHF